MRVMIAGQIGREAAVATRLAEEGNELIIASEFANPTLVEMAESSGGEFHHMNIYDIWRLGGLASKARAELLWINDDNVLEASGVNGITSWVPSILSASPTRGDARLEWDKFDTRQIVEEIDTEWQTEYNPRHILATTAAETVAAIDYFEQEGTEVVVKPRGLSGGKGVKVMGPHLSTHDEASQYAKKLVGKGDKHGGVSIEEKLQGPEFTLQGFTDGKTLILAPETYDYPYREDGDTGPGTGGMGSFTMPAGERLPFLTDDEHGQADRLMHKVLEKLEERGRDFKGILYGSFFKTDKGLKLTEFNVRGGDPELINIIELLEDDVSLTNVLSHIATGQLSQEDLRFKSRASAVVYLVAPNYAYERGKKSVEFELDTAEIAAHGCRTYFAAAARRPGGSTLYRTVGTSRTAAIASRGESPVEARSKILEAINAGVSGPLQFRNDIASPEYLERLATS